MVNTGGARGGKASASSYSNRKDFIRNSNHQRKLKCAKLRDNIGVIGRKTSLKLGLLNVDGLSASTLEDVKSAVNRKSLHICILLETKRRHEEVAADISIDGYSCHEASRMLRETRVEEV